MKAKTKTTAKRAKPGRKRPSREAIQAEALRNALSHDSSMNYEAIIEGFEEMGINPDDIEPRVNVFTFNAWLAQGRCVRAGQHGVKVVTYVERKSKAADGAAPSPLDVAIAAQEGQAKPQLIPRTTTVFHISQTDPVKPRGQVEASPVPSTEELSEEEADA